MEDVLKIAKDYFRSRETIDEDVLRKLKEQDTYFIDVLKVLKGLGFSLREAQDITAKSKHYADDYNRSADFTEQFFDALSKE